MERISVIIPVYRVEPYLRKCLDSVANQTYRNLEIVVIDDGSPDRCGAICDEYAEQDARFVVIHKQNGGLSAARNDGIERATGEWIAFVDSDDWCEPDYYERLLQNGADPRTDVVCASAHVCFDEASETQKQRRCFARGFVFRTKEEQHSLMNRVLSKSEGRLRGNSAFGYPWDKLYRPKFLAENHLCFDTSLRVCEDSLFNYMVMSRARQVEGRDCAGYHYRVNRASITKAYDPNRPEKNYQYIKKLCDYAAEYGIDAEMKEFLDQHTFRTMSSCLGMVFFHSQNKESLAQVMEGIQRMLEWPRYREVVQSNDNRYLTLKQVALKHILRNPNGGGMLRTFYRIKRILR